MIRIIFLVCLLFICTTFLHASDTIIVHQDARLDIFTAKQAAVNKLNSKMTSNGQYKGFRLQVLNSHSRDEAFKTKSELLQLFPGQKSYVLYQSPYFKVRIGNFIEKTEALSFRNRLMKKYPQNAYVVEDIIEYTPGEEEDPSAN
ncbi:MAG: SPOR domain-containing protein [Panacibacter sp.]